MTIPPPTYMCAECLHMSKKPSIYSYSQVNLNYLKQVLGSWNFSRVTLKAFIRIRMTLWTIQNDYFDHVRHVWDIFGNIRSLKIIFWDYIFENFRLKMNKNTFFGILWLYKGNYYLFKLRNEEFRCLRSEYMTNIIS